MVSWVEQSLSQSGEGGTCPKGVGRNYTGNSLRVGAGPGGVEEPCGAQFSEEGSLGGQRGPSLGTDWAQEVAQTPSRGRAFAHVYPCVLRLRKTWEA